LRYDGVPNRMNRRRFVAGLFSAGVGASVAGCLGSTGADTGSPRPVETLPPSATAGFDYVDADDVRAHDELRIRDYSVPRSVGGIPGVSLDQVNGAVAFGERNATVTAEGEFNVSEASTALGSEGFTESDGREGYRLFERYDGAVALDGETCIRSALGPDAVRRTVDASADTGVKATDTDDGFASLVDALGNGTFVTGRAVYDDPVVARGKRVGTEAGGSTAEVTVVRVFRTEAEATNRTATVNATADGGIRGRVAESDGRVVRVTGEADVDRL
jgi:hypothetical protein